MIDYAKILEEFTHAYNRESRAGVVIAYRKLVDCSGSEALHWFKQHQNKSVPGGLDWDALFQGFMNEYEKACRREESLFAKVTADLQVVQETWRSYGYQSPQAAIVAYMRNYLQNQGDEK